MPPVNRVSKLWTPKVASESDDQTNNRTTCIYVKKTNDLHCTSTENLCNTHKFFFVCHQR